MFEYGSGSNEGTMWRAVVTALMAIVLIVTPVEGTIFTVGVAFKNIFVLLLLFLTRFLHLKNTFFVVIITVKIMLIVIIVIIIRFLGLFALAML